MKPPVFYTGNTLPEDRQILAVFEPVAVDRLPLDLGEAALAYDGGAFCVLPGAGRAPYRPPALKAERISRKSLLARACGDRGPVLDAMAGWGTDALTLQALGLSVRVVERQPVVWGMLRGLGLNADLGDGFEWLHRQPWGVIYLDPMFEPRGRKGLAKQPLQMLQELAHADTRTLAEWIEAARSSAVDRVVLKQRRTAPPVARPDWQLKGRSVRFDVYRPAVRRAETDVG